jgi:uncharacterized phage protein gp47/JayE
VDAVADALATYINTLGLGVPLRWSKLEQIIYNTSPFITNAQSLLVNGAENDIEAALYHTVKVSSVTVA